jgi:small subunit ribosomal protein S20
LQEEHQLAKAAPKKNLSALKRVRQADKQGLRNQSKKAEIKTLEKKLESILPSTSREEVEKQLRYAVKTITSASSKGIIHKNTASRKVSRATKLANAVGKKS